MSSSSNVRSGESAGLDLDQLFGSVVEALSENRDQLNQLDGYNGDHGDNMVQIFQVAAEALSKHKGKSPEKALSYAANRIKKLPSGSAQVYAGSFENAARQFQGRASLGSNDVSALLTTLLGLGGAIQTGAQPTQQEDPLGSLLGALSGDPSETGTGLDTDALVSNLLRGGLSFLQAKEGGQDILSAGLQGLLSASPFGEVPHRQQSASVVASSLLNALPSLLGQK